MVKLKDKASEWLQKRLSEGPDKAKNIITDAEAIGIKYDTLNNVRKILGYETIKAGFLNGEWLWFNPHIKLTEAQRKAWFEKHAAWVTDYRDIIDEGVGRSEWKATEFFNDWKEDLYDQINKDSMPYYFDESRRLKKETIENYYKELIEKEKKAATEGSEERIATLEKHLDVYIKNKQVLIDGIKSHHKDLDINKTDRWLLDQLKDGPKERYVIVSEADKLGINETDLEKSRIKLRLEVIGGITDNIWWSDLDRDHRKKSNRTMKSHLTEKKRESYLHRREYSDIFGHTFNGKDNVKPDASVSYETEDVPLSHFYNEALENKECTNIPHKEIEELKQHHNEKYKEWKSPKDRGVPLEDWIEHGTNKENSPSEENASSGKKVRRYSTWSLI